ncbi:MAG: alpha/beta hydrolase [Pyrinomonadaceae bacterium]
MYPAGNLFINAPHGRLEAILKEPRATDDVETKGSGAALVLHPHPLHGGTMHNKVVFRAAGALNDAGLTTLRINFRGVGSSTGTHDDARGEKEDASVALDYLQTHYTDDDITLAGFSFGARVGLEVGIADRRVRWLIGIGTPVDKYDFAFLENCRKPILFVHGDRDEFGSAASLRALIAKLPAEAHARLALIEGAEHFFEGHLDELKRAITDWTREQLEHANASAS